MAVYTIPYNVYSCPHCHKQYATRLLTLPHIGPSLRTCFYCKQQFLSHDREWATFSIFEKAYFLFSPFMLLAAFCYFLFAFSVMIDQSTIDWLFIGVWSVVGLPVFLPYTLNRVCTIRASNKRVALSNPLSNTLGTPTLKLR